MLSHSMFLFSQTAAGSFVPRCNPAACQLWKRTAALDNHVVTPDKWRLLLSVSASP